MGTRAGIATLAALAVATASAQPYRLGRALSKEFLTRLVQHRLMPSQVAIINASVGSVMILDAHAQGPIVFIDGASNFLWAQIAEQLASLQPQDESLHLSIAHRVIEVASCPAMTEHAGAFLERLNTFVSIADDRSSTSIPQLIILDATEYRIITSERAASVMIEPNGSLDPPLQQAAGQLHSQVSRCAGSLMPEVQQHDF